MVQLVKNLPDMGDLGSIPGLESSPGEGKGYPLQYSGLENSMDCIFHGVSKSQTGLSNFHFNQLLKLHRLSHSLCGSLPWALFKAPLRRTLFLAHLASCWEGSVSPCCGTEGSLLHELLVGGLPPFLVMGACSQSILQ